jgi:hypothetical protein
MNGEEAKQREGGRKNHRAALSFVRGGKRFVEEGVQNAVVATNSLVGGQLPVAYTRTDGAVGTDEWVRLERRDFGPQR